MEVLHISSTEEWPSHVPEEIWLESDDERHKLMDKVLSTIIEKFVNISYNKRKSDTHDDKVLMHAEQVLSVGALHAELADAVQQGDGERVIRLWRYFMLLFHNLNRKNYAKKAVLLLLQYEYTLSCTQVSELLYGRFVNTRRVPEANISTDLFMEHLNRQLKDGMGSSWERLATLFEKRRSRSQVI